MQRTDAAQIVRREFLRTCLTARGRHKQMTAFALHQILTRQHHVTSWLDDHQFAGPPVLAEILGDEPIKAAVNAPATRHPVMLWAYTVAAHEAALPRDAHRDHDPERADYLRHLVGLGYTTADVEQRIIDNVYPPADTASANDGPTSAT